MLRYGYLCFFASARRFPGSRLVGIYKLYNILMTTARIIGRSGDDDAVKVFYRKASFRESL